MNIIIKKSMNESFDRLRTNGKLLIPFVVMLRLSKHRNHERNPLIQHLPRLAAAFCAVLIILSTAQAQTYPVKPVRIILPFAGGSDTVGRLIAGKLSTALGQQVVPDPRVGASGNIGFLAGAKSPADGYTLMMGAVPVLTNPMLNPKVGFDGLRDFTPVVLLATIPNV